jgi:hypothetical protein
MIARAMITSPWAFGATIQHWMTFSSAKEIIPKLNDPKVTLFITPEITDLKEFINIIRTHNEAPSKIMLFNNEVILYSDYSGNQFKLDLFNFKEEFINEIEGRDKSVS